MPRLDVEARAEANRLMCELCNAGRLTLLTRAEICPSTLEADTGRGTQVSSVGRLARHYHSSSHSKQKSNALLVMRKESLCLPSSRRKSHDTRPSSGHTTSTYPITALSVISRRQKGGSGGSRKGTPAQATHLLLAGQVRCQGKRVAIPDPPPPLLWYFCKYCLLK